MTTTIAGTITKLYHASDNFTAGRIRTCNNGQEEPFAGRVGGLRENDIVTLSGKYHDDPKYGRQFHVKSFEFTSELNVADVVTYIKNDPTVKGIGAARAMMIGEKFGIEFDAVVTNSWERLTEIPGVTLEIARGLHENWTEFKHINSVRTKLAGFGLTHNQICKLIEKYGGNAARILTENPYQLIDDIDGWGFTRSDEVARKTGTIPKTFEPRLRAGILYTMDRELNDGHCWTERIALIDKSVQTLKLDGLESGALVSATLDMLIDEGDKIRQSIIDMKNGQVRRAISFKWIYEQEHYIYMVLKTYSQKPSAHDEFRGHLQPSPESLSGGQSRAFGRAMSKRFSVITGGAGTGKTYTISAIAHAYRGAGYGVALTAPTGKAAKRMEEAAGLSAKTTHRLLEHNGKVFQRDETNKLECDIIIVDEFSMVDVPLCGALFSAIDWNTTNVVVVGDHHQLPSVGPGNIMRDVVRRDYAKVTALDQVVRQAGPLRTKCQSILAGSFSRERESDSWYVADGFGDSVAALEFILYIYRNVLHEKFGLDLINDVQLITAKHDGALGTKSLNINLQALIQHKVHGVVVDSPPDGGKKRHPKFYKGDRIIQMVNDYDLGAAGIMNGTVGTVIGLDVLNHEQKKCVRVDFDGEIVDVPHDKRGRMSLAYASTIHKSQGSEYPCVVVVCHKSHSFMHHRNLLYTAVTRAKDMVVVIGDRWGMKNAARKVDPLCRRTFLNVLSGENYETD